MSLRSSMIHGKKWKHQHPQEEDDSKKWSEGFKTNAGGHCRCGGDRTRAGVGSGAWSTGLSGRVSGGILRGGAASHDEQSQWPRDGGDSRGRVLKWRPRIQSATYTCLVKQWQGLGGLTPFLKAALLWGEAIKQFHMLQRNHLWKEQSARQTSLLSHFKILPRAPHPSATTSPTDHSADTTSKLTLHWQHHDSLKAQIQLAFFGNQVFFH